ncbi:MAG: endolytic transglycosylase MltG [Flavobacteriales bacterium]
MKRKKKQSSFFRKFILLSFLISCFAGILLCIQLYKNVFNTNIVFSGDKEKLLFINSDDDFNNVLNKLSDINLLNVNTFKWVANKKKYIQNIKPGRYLINNEMSINDLINLLKSGNQTPVKITFNNTRTINDFVSNISSSLEIDSVSLLNAIYDKNFLLNNKLTNENVGCIFIPNTYEFYWNVSSEGFLNRMLLEYDKFWNNDRIKKSKLIPLNLNEISILASIVQMEQNIKYDERPIIAGLYLNRINQNMKLESDPTLIFALKDFSLKRVLNKDKKVLSPYNTYKNKGLPPGPICMPSINAIDAVLNFDKHNYIFMCAKEDLSGYHNFAVTYKKHLKNARRYQKMLSKKKIFR